MEVDLEAMTDEILEEINKKYKKDDLILLGSQARIDSKSTSMFSYVASL
jgi:hypothetical protein